MIKLPKGGLPIEVIEKMIADQQARIDQIQETEEMEKRARRRQQKLASWHKNKHKYRTKEVK